MKENLAKLPFQSSTLLIENYSQNQWNYLQINSKQTESSKTKKSFFPVTFSTNPNKIKLQMLQEGLKCKQLEQNTIYIIQRELQINNHKVDNGLNKVAIRDN